MNECHEIVLRNGVMDTIDTVNRLYVTLSASDQPCFPYLMQQAFALV
jgi:hypothetical protein